ncbi:MAG TPA: hypothetical protein VEJ00_12755, partial [Candidatus Acidoferrales bacterium]|nr:hypothetical protein [Candidatus Acidoferrales bacterium]
MDQVTETLTRNRRRRLARFVALTVALLVPLSAFGGKKKKEVPTPAPVIDYSNIVWPNPPAIARIRYQAFYASQQISQVNTAPTKKEKWMDR